ncbi:unnamed protein product [Camellia sinensis]
MSWRGKRDCQRLAGKENRPTVVVEVAIVTRKGKQSSEMGYEGKRVARGSWRRGMGNEEGLAGSDGNKKMKINGFNYGCNSGRFSWIEKLSKTLSRMAITIMYCVAPTENFRRDGKNEGLAYNLLQPHPL